MQINVKVFSGIPSVETISIPSDFFKNFQKSSKIVKNAYFFANFFKSRLEKRVKLWHILAVSNFTRKTGDGNGQKRQFQKTAFD